MRAVETVVSRQGLVKQGLRGELDALRPPAALMVSPSAAGTEPGEECSGRYLPGRAVVLACRAESAQAVSARVVSRRVGGDRDSVRNVAFG